MKVRVSPQLKFKSNGIGLIALKDYEDFDYVIQNILLDHPYLIFRGQSDSTWPLRSSLDRLFLDARKELPSQEDASFLLDKFKYSTRGRIAPNFVPRDDNAWWALGQHFGLATPLLDWTESPFVAAYFSFLKQVNKSGDKYPNRAIWIIDPEEIRKKSDELSDMERVEIINPLLDHNARLVNQRGLFTKLPVGVDLEGWVDKHFKDDNSCFALIKIEIPEEDSHRNKFLQFLNRANVNSLTLFPDLSGASEHCNNNVLISNYE